MKILINISFMIGIFILSVHALNENVNPSQPRECYSCQGINCQRTTKSNVKTTCTDLLDICVTIFEGYTVAAKGCYLNIPEEYRNKCDDDKNPECLKCFGQLCNNKGRADFKCIECNSNDISKCATDTSNIIPTQCETPTTINSYCFVRNTNTKTVIRGCFTKLQDQLNCLNDASCSMCLSEDGIACNSYGLSLSVDDNSGATRDLSLSLSVMILISFISIFFIRFR